MASVSRRKPAPSQLEVRSKAAAANWVKFTLVTDTQKLGFLPHVVWNWLLIFALATGWWYMWREQWTILAAVTGGLLLASMIRAGSHLPARRRTLEQVVAGTRAPFRHPNSTTTRPVNPADRVQVSRWGRPGKPRAGAVVYNPGSAAANVKTRGAAEQNLADALPAVKNHGWLFDWNTAPGQVRFSSIPANDPRLAAQTFRRWVDQVAADLFRTPDLVCVIDWAEAEDRLDPASITIEYGAGVNADVMFRQAVERDFDHRVTRANLVWLYDWDTPGVLVVTAAQPDSAEAVRKAAGRKISDALTTILAKAGGRGAAKQLSVQVTNWLDNNTPTHIEANYGTLDYSDSTTRWTIMDQIDRVLEGDYRDRVWLPEWRSGVHGQLLLTAVPTNHPEAQRKAETGRLRFVATEGFPRTITPEVEVTEWADEGGQQRPKTIVVDYGSGDMTKIDNRRAFQTHLDSQILTNDWRFDWDTPRQVTITAVPPLPNYVPFPAEGSPELARWHELFREGKIMFGPAKGGYETIIDLSKSPHLLVGGSTGAGKSVLLTLILYGVLMNRDVCEVVVADPKVTDFTWTPGYPNVRMYAVRDVRKSIAELKALTGLAVREMNRRQSLLRQHGAENLGELRRMASTGQANVSLAEIPKRLIVFFDEGGAAFTPVKDADLRAEQDAARTDLEQVGMLGRAMEVNIVMAAQKPSGENIGTAMRAQLVNRFCVGNVGVNESIQILGSPLGNTISGPKGRGLMFDDAGRELTFQTYYLPKRNSPDPLNPTVELQGLQERVAASLEAEGFVAVEMFEDMVTENADGDPVTVRVPYTKWQMPGQQPTSGPAGATPGSVPAGQQPPVVSAGPGPEDDPSNWTKIEVPGPDGLPVPKWVRLDRIDAAPQQRSEEPAGAFVGASPHPGGPQHGGGLPTSQQTPPRR